MLFKKVVTQQGNLLQEYLGGDELQVQSFRLGLGEQSPAFVRK